MASTIESIVIELLQDGIKEVLNQDIKVTMLGLNSYDIANNNSMLEAFNLTMIPIASVGLKFINGNNFLVSSYNLDYSTKIINNDKLQDVIANFNKIEQVFSKKINQLTAKKIGNIEFSNFIYELDTKPHRITIPSQSDFITTRLRFTIKWYNEYIDNNSN